LLPSQYPLPYASISTITLFYLFYLIFTVVYTVALIFVTVILIFTVVYTVALIFVAIILIFTVVYTVTLIFVTVILIFTVVYTVTLFFITIILIFTVVYTVILCFTAAILIFIVVFIYMNMGSSSERIIIQKLKGASNYEVWALRTEAFLIKEGLKDAISSDLFALEEDINDKALANIKLLVEDGPLLQIQHISTALEAWESFKNLYSPKGFTSEFLICREFFNTTLDNLSSMEEYLNKVKQLSDQLKAKQLELPY
jgi:hypothetical protein